MSSNDQPITVIVEFRIRTETTSLDEWLDAWQARAEDAWEHEPDTTAYEAAVHVEDDSRVLVYERYECGLPGLETHMARPSHKTIGEIMGARRMNESRPVANVALDVPDFGWWAREGSAPQARAAGQPLTILAMRYADEAHRGRYLELAGQHASGRRAAEPDTLVHAAAIAGDDLESASPLRQGDLLLVTAHTDDDAEKQTAEREAALDAKLAGWPASPSWPWPRDCRHLNTPAST